jgi:hypothetical protein
LIRLEAKTYTFPNRNLSLRLEDELNFGGDPAIYHLCGENGLGKTSFLEQLLTPTLKDANMDYLYLGQDLGTQIYTLRASLAVAGHGLANMRERDMLELWIREGHPARVFILDEFDKYYTDYAFVFAASQDFISTYVMVSHLDLCDLEALGLRHGLYEIAFALEEIKDGVKHVRLDVENL